MKFVEKIKAIAKRGKALICTAAAAVSTAAIAVCASAETADEAASAGSDMTAILTSAGTQLTEQFNSLVTTIIPVILGILGSGLVIFGIMALIRLAKKTFGKVAG